VSVTHVKNISVYEHAVFHRTLNSPYGNMIIIIIHDSSIHSKGEWQNWVLFCR